MNRFRALVAVVLMLPSLAFAADDPLAGIRDLLLSGHAKEAREQLVKARDGFVAQSDAPREAAAWLLIGVADSALDDQTSARSEFEQSAAKFTAIDDSFAAWLSLMMLGEMERMHGQLDRSISVHERGIALLQKAAEPNAPFSLATMKIIGPVFGVPVEMLGPMADYPDVVKPMLLRIADTMARDTYGHALTEAGALAKADEQLTLASAGAAMFGGLFDTMIAMHVGDLRQRQWRLEEARASYVKALDGGRAMRMMSAGDPHAELSVLRRLGELDVFSGRVQEALEWNDRALKLVRDLNLPKREFDILENRADLLHKAGRSGEAQALYEEILKRATANDDLDQQASVQTALGTLHMLQGTYGTAARHLEKAIELNQRLKNPYLEAAAWINLAEVDLQVDMNDSATDALTNARALAQKSDFKMAEAMIDMARSFQKLKSSHGAMSDLDEALKAWLELPEARDLTADQATQNFRDLLRFFGGGPLHDAANPVPATGPPLNQTMPLMLQGKILLDRGDREGARAAWNRALETKPNTDLRAGLFGMIGASYWTEGKREDAIRNFAKSASTLELSAEDVRVEEMLAGYLGSERRWYYDLLIDMLLTEGRWQEAFGQAERARARAFLQMVGNHRFNAERGADPRLLREAETLRTEIAARERQPKEAEREELALLHQRYKALLTRVKVSNPEYESLTNVQPLQLEDVQKELPADATLISYFVTPNLVHAWIVEREDAHYVKLPLDQAGLQGIVCWAGSFGSRPFVRGVRVPGPCDKPATAEDAFDRLIAPIAATIKGHKLILVPHGVLHYVPFAALRNRESGHCLIDDYTLTYAPSASSLRFLRAKESPVDGAALVIGDPETSLPKLPGAAQEATAVARMLSTTAHLGADGREALLDDVHGNVDLVHLAAHGVYDPANPLFSKIALAGDATHDGNLTVRDILSSVDLTGVNLVVLSSCESAAGARSGGDEVVGLTRALLYAGTPGVISTLWNIDDTASAKLMEEFYRRLTAGASAADALRQAQLFVKEQYEDPKFWAAFMLTGDPRGRWQHTE